MRNETCRRYLEAWLHQVEEPHGEKTLEAARHVASCAACSARLAQMARALDSPREDRLTCDDCQARLPDYIHAQVIGVVDNTQFAHVRGHLALCPYCADAYAQVYEWVLAGQADAVPVAAAYPRFDLPFPAAPARPVEVVQQALAQGRHWVEDALGGIYVLFGPGLQTQTAATWATKSAQPGSLLYQTVLGEEAVPGWEIEVMAFAEDENACRVEVALYRPGMPDADLAGTPVSLQIDQAVQVAKTDDAGVAEFGDVPIEALDRAAVRVALDG